MMSWKKSVLSLLMYIVLAMAFGSLQSSLWFLFFGKVPAPLFWLLLIIYISLFRTSTEAIISVYAISFILIAFTAVPLGLLLLVNISVYLMVSMIRSRVFWEGASYFMFVVALSVPIFYGVHWILSLSLESNSMYEPPLLRALYHVVVTPLFAFPFYFLFTAIDRQLNLDKTDTGEYVYE
jgi:hypothetical protein